jgi:hypothetical protein
MRFFTALIILMLSAMLYVERAEALVDNTDSYDVR